MSLLGMELVNPSKQDFENSIRLSPNETKVITRTLSRGDLQQAVRKSGLKLDKINVNGHDVDCSPTASPLMARRSPKNPSRTDSPVQLKRTFSDLSNILNVTCSSSLCATTGSSCISEHYLDDFVIEFDSKDKLFNIKYHNETVLQIKTSKEVLQNALKKDFAISLFIDKKYVCNVIINQNEQLDTYEYSIPNPEICDITNDSITFKKNNASYKFKFDEQNINEMMKQIDEMMKQIDESNDNHMKIYI